MYGELLLGSIRCPAVQKCRHPATVVSESIQHLFHLQTDYRKRVAAHAQWRFLASRCHCRGFGDYITARRLCYGGIQCSPINQARTRSISETIFCVKTQNLHYDTASAVETQNFRYETRVPVSTTFPLRNEIICSKHRFLNCNLKCKLKVAICIYVYSRFHFVMGK